MPENKTLLRRQWLIGDRALIADGPAALSPLETAQVRLHIGAPRFPDGGVSIAGAAPEDSQMT